jgi:hypothetical protein
MLPVDAQHLAVGAHRGRVVQVGVGLWEPDDRRGMTSARRNLVECLHRLCDKRRPQQQVLGRIPADGELGERHKIAALLLGTLVRRQDLGAVAIEITDDEVELRGSDPQTRHDPRIRGGAFSELLQLRIATMEH